MYYTHIIYVYTYLFVYLYIYLFVYSFLICARRASPRPLQEEKKKTHKRQHNTLIAVVKYSTIHKIQYNTLIQYYS